MMPGLHIPYFAEFQSTSSSRSQTDIVFDGNYWDFNFNPLAPRGARRKTLCWVCTASGNFNPLAPRGARRSNIMAAYAKIYFNPLAPRGARRNLYRLTTKSKYFNPLAPRGARPQPVAQPVDNIMISIH